MFQMHRVFCATPWEMDAERGCFYDVIGQVNETHAMAKGVLYVPVSLVNIRDKRPVQYVVDENIRDARHFILLLSENWGPTERNFENDYLLARECAADPALPMREVALLRRIERSGRPLAEGIPEPDAAFSTTGEFKECVRDLLVRWLANLDANTDANKTTA
jgi:hypothetical protein